MKRLLWLTLGVVGVKRLIIVIERSLLVDDAVRWPIGSFCLGKWEMHSSNISSTSHVPRVKPHEYLWLMHVISICRNFMHTRGRWINFHRFDDTFVCRLAIAAWLLQLLPEFLTFSRSASITSDARGQFLDPIIHPNSVPLRSCMCSAHRELVSLSLLQFWELSPSFAHEIINLECKFIRNHFPIKKSTSLVVKFNKL